MADLRSSILHQAKEKFPMSKEKTPAEFVALVRESFGPDFGLKQKSSQYLSAII